MGFCLNCVRVFPCARTRHLLFLARAFIRSLLPGQSCKNRLEEAESELESMEKRGGLDPPTTPGAEEELLQTLKAQREVIEAERKVGSFEAFLFTLHPPQGEGGCILTHVPPPSPKGVLRQKNAASWRVT